MSNADHSEARERARQENLELFAKLGKVCEKLRPGTGGGIELLLTQAYDKGEEAGRRSLEQERDELQAQLLKHGRHAMFCTVHVRVGNDPFVCNCGWEVLKAKLAPPVHKGDS